MKITVLIILYFVLETSNLKNVKISFAAKYVEC